MKQCPDCNRIYEDETLNYCLDDGTSLRQLPTDEAATAVLPAAGVSAEGPTKLYRGAAKLSSHPREKPAPSTAAGPDRAAGKRLYVRIGLILFIIAAAFMAFRFVPSSGGDKQIKSIAVMPFANESGSADLEYLTDGMTESLITSLSQLPNLNVKARSSVFRYKGREIEPRTAAGELSVEALLLGRVVQQGDSVALHIELVDPKTENALWRADYNRPVANLASLQNELARDVATRLKARLSGAEEQRLGKRQTDDPETYKLYLMGRYQLNRLTDDGFRKAADHFLNAIARDPNYAPAFAGLAETYNRLSGWNAIAPRDGFPKAREAAVKALELDPTLAEARTTLGAVKHYYDWDPRGAENEFKRAIVLDPNSAEARSMYGYFLSAVGRFDEAMSQMRIAQELDPLSIEKIAGVGEVLYLERRYDEAVEQYRKALELDPNSGFAHWAIGRAMIEKGSYDDAIATLRKAIAFSGDSPDEIVELGRAYARAGRRAEALKVIDDLRQLATRRYVSPASIGSIYAGMGEKDQAFVWFERALEERDFLLVLFKVDPLFDGVRSDARFSDLVKRAGLAV